MSADVREMMKMINTEVAKDSKGGGSADQWSLQRPIAPSRTKDGRGGATEFQRDWVFSITTFGCGLALFGTIKSVVNTRQDKTRHTHEHAILSFAEAW